MSARRSRVAPLALALVAAVGLLSAGPSRAACKLQQQLQLPVTMVGTQPTVPVKVNGMERRFLLDSGAFYSMIAPSAVTAFGLKSVYEPRLRLSGIGGRVEAQSTIVKDFGLGNASHRNVQFLIADGADGGGADGILGQNVLGAADVEYDLANGIVRFFKPQDCGSGVLAYWPGGPVRSLDLLSDAPTLTHKIQALGALNGQTIRLTFDTGASRSMITLPAAARAGVAPNTPGAAFAGQSRGLGRDRVDTWIAPFDVFALGGEVIEHNRIRFGAQDMDGSDMLLGADFFLSHRVYVANSQHKIYFTYNGGPVFQPVAPRDTPPPPKTTDRPAAPLASAAQAAPLDINIPTDAAGFDRRGAASMGRRDFPHAIDDFTQAIALDPADPKPVYDRGMARWADGQLAPAMSDFTQALTLKPDDASALLAQGSLYALAGDRARAYRDFLAAEGIAGADPHIGLAVADAYFRLGALEDALRQFDRWIAANPHADLGGALEGRCRTRALLKTDLDKALADCTAALASNPRETGALHMRGLVEYLRGDFDAAVSDLDAVLRLQPDNAMALYTRGMAKQRGGQTGAGAADLQAASAITPKAAEQGRQLGLWP